MGIFDAIKNVATQFGSLAPLIAAKAKESKAKEQAIQLAERTARPYTPQPNPRVVQDLKTAGYSPEEATRRASTPLEMPQGDPLFNAISQVLNVPNKLGGLAAETLAGKTKEPGETLESYYERSPSLTDIAGKSLMDTSKKVFGEEYGTPIGSAGMFIAALTLDPFNLVPFGAADDVIKLLAEEKNATKVLPYLKQMKVSDDLIEGVSEAVAKASTPEEVKSVLGKAEKVMKTTKKDTFGMNGGDIGFTSKSEKGRQKGIDDYLKAQRSLDGYVSPYGPTPPKTDTLDPLTLEARKYKSAEEFVKGNTPVFRGGRAGVSFDSSKVTDDGVSVSFGREPASRFAPVSKNVEEFFVDKNARILSFDDIPGEYVKKSRAAGGLTPVDGTAKGIVDYARKEGYDAVDLKKFGEGELRVLNPDILKTKSQLTDIWNKANDPSTRLAKQADVLGAESTIPSELKVAPKGTQPAIGRKPDILPSQGSFPQASGPRGVGQALEGNLAETPKIARVVQKTAKTLNEPLSTVQRVVDRVKRAFTGTVEYVQNSEERVRQLMDRTNLKVSDVSDPYLKATLYPGRVANKVEQGRKEAESIIKATKEVADNFKSSSKEIRKELNDYLLYKHAPERNLALGEKAAGVTTQEAESGLKAILNSPRGAEIKKLAERAAKLNEQTLDLLKESGVISDELYTTLRTKYKNHVPLQRVFEETEDMGSVLAGRGFDVRSTGIKKAVGSEREVDDILGNIVTNYEQAVLRSEKNIVDQATLAFARDNKDILGDLLEVIKPKAIGNAFDGKVLLEKTNDPSILQMFEKGKPVWIKVNDPALAVALRGVGREKLGLLLQKVGAVTRFYAGLATRFNPEFAFPNKLRDLQETAVYLASQKGVGFKGAAKAVTKDPKSVKGVIDALRGVDSEGARLYNEMKSLGGTTGGFGLSTKTETKLNLDKLEKIANSKTRQIANNLVEYVDDWNSIFEDSTRLSVYKQGLEQGLSKERAAFLAKEASINFNRMGKGGPLINALWMFSNASIQGSAKMIRSLKNPKVLGATVLAVGGSVAAVNQWNDQIDPEWRNKVSKWDRLNGLPIVLPSPDGEGVKYVTIPVSWGIKPIKVMADYAYDAASGQGAEVKDVMNDTMTAIIEAYNPVGGSDLVSALSPTILDTPFEIYRNVSWSGNKIRPDFDQNAPADIQYFRSLGETKTGQAAISISELLKDKADISISPASLKYAFEAYVGGAGKAVSKTVNTITGGIQGKIPPPDEYPIISRFYRERTEEEVGSGSGGQTNEIKKILEKQSSDRFDARRQAEALDKELSNTDSQSANDRIKELKSENPALYEKVKEVYQERKLGLTYTEKLMKQLGVENGERAKYIHSQIISKPREERQAYYNELKAKKVISKEVAKQLKKLQNP